MKQKTLNRLLYSDQEFGDHVPERTFDFCALHYLNLWLQKESNYCEMLSSADILTQQQALREASVYFHIARNLPTRFEQNKDSRYYSVLEVLNGIDEITEDNVVDIVTDTSKRISEHYGGTRTISSTSKFLWLKFKQPVRIYDSQSCHSLGTPKNDFAAFNDAFSEQYSNHKQEILTACSKLKNQLSYTVQPKMKQTDIETITSKDWFHERVFDIYLWNKGNINK